MLQGMTGAINEAQRIVAAQPNAFMLQQFDNPANREVHYKTTGGGSFGGKGVLLGATRCWRASPPWSSGGVDMLDRWVDV